MQAGTARGSLMFMKPSTMARFIWLSIGRLPVILVRHARSGSTPACERSAPRPSAPLTACASDRSGVKSSAAMKTSSARGSCMFARASRIFSRAPTSSRYCLKAVTIGGTRTSRNALTAGSSLLPFLLFRVSV